MLNLWFKAFHILFMVAWMAGLLYLPRLFVYHVQSTDQISRERFQTMERRLYFGIMWPALILTAASGIAMLISYAWSAYIHELWFQVKLGFAILLVIYHFICGHWLKRLANGTNQHSHKFFRAVNEIPFFILFVIVVCVIVRPF